MSSQDAHHPSTGSAEDDALPTSQQLAAANSVSVQDASGAQIAFPTLVQNANNKGLPFVLIFTRHFHCGMCMEYIRALGQSSILTDPSKVSIAVIGPGQAEGINHYKTQVNNPPFDFFADPNIKLYTALGVTRRTLDSGNPSKDKIPSHHKSSMLLGAAKSVVESITSGKLAFKGGDIKQLGGEFVFDRQGNPIFAHRMRHTRDHVEVSDLENLVSQ